MHNLWVDLHVKERIGKCLVWHDHSLHSCGSLTKECALLLLKIVEREKVPEVEADFKQLVFLDVGALNEVNQALLNIFLQELNILISLHRVARLLN